MCALSRRFTSFNNLDPDARRQEITWGLHGAGKCQLGNQLPSRRQNVDCETPNPHSRNR